MLYWGISLRKCVYRYWKESIQQEKYKCHFKWTIKNFAWGFHWLSSLHWRELGSTLPLLQGDLEALCVLSSPFSFLAFCYFNLYAHCDVMGLWLGSAVIEVAGWLKKYFFSFVLLEEPCNTQDGGEKFRSPWAQKAQKSSQANFPFEASPVVQGVSNLSFTETAVQEVAVKTIYSLS